MISNSFSCYAETKGEKHYGIQIRHRDRTGMRNAVPITEIAEKAGIDDKYLEQYGKYKAKIDYNLLREDRQTKWKADPRDSYQPDSSR